MFVESVDLRAVGVVDDKANGAATSAFIPNADGERPFVQVGLTDGRTLTLMQPPVAVPFIIATILGPQQASNTLAVTSESMSVKTPCTLRRWRRRCDPFHPTSKSTP